MSAVVSSRIIKDNSHKLNPKEKLILHQRFKSSGLNLILVYRNKYILNYFMQSNDVGMWIKTSHRLNFAKVIDLVHTVY